MKYFLPGSIAVATVGALVVVAAILVGLSGMASRLTKERSLHRTIRMEVTSGPEDPFVRRSLLV